MAILKGDPTPEIVRKMIPNPGTGFGTITATGTLMAGLKVQRIALNATSSANAATTWINPEPGTVLGQALLVFTTAGSAGTFDMGRGSDGTGNANNIIDGGTMTVGVHAYGTVLGTAAASATVGGVDGVWLLYGPGGTGTNNSVNVTHNDLPSATAVGYLIVSYFRVD